LLGLDTSRVLLPDTVQQDGAQDYSTNEKKSNETNSQFLRIMSAEQE
jgi:hypothetical protein